MAPRTHTFPGKFDILSAIIVIALQLLEIRNVFELAIAERSLELQSPISRRLRRRAIGEANQDCRNVCAGHWAAKEKLL